MKVVVGRNRLTVNSWAQAMCIVEVQLKEQARIDGAGDGIFACLVTAIMLFL
jgi:hypothetical protein